MILIIAEKPSLGRNIASAIGNLSRRKGYLEGEQKRQNEEEQALLRDCEQQLEQFAHSLARQKAKRTEQI